MPEGRATAGGNLMAPREESQGSREERCRVTPGQGNLRESATENIPPLLRHGKVEMVR